MDISITKKKNSIGKRLIPALAAVGVLSAALYYGVFLSQADIAINDETILYGEVKQGDFSVSVRGSGSLVADQIQWLASSVDGHVERVIVKPGKLVKKGELIIEMANPQLLQMLDETKWELEAQIAESKAKQVEQNTAILMQKAAMLNAKLNYESSRLKLDAHSELMAQNTGAVSKVDYQETLLETEQFKQRWIIQQDIHKTMTNNLFAQSNARESRLNKMRKTLERAEQQVHDLKIYATMDSVVQEVAVEPGQRINMGSSLAKLAQQDSLIAELQVPELLIGEVSIGQEVIIDTRNNKVSGVVSRVDPAVVNGNVQVDVVFEGELPQDARPDLSVDGEIKITDIANTLYVNKPVFAQSNSRSTVYKIDDAGNFAQRVKVSLGKGSVNQVQIIEGLNLGDKIIISDTTDFQHFQTIRIN